MIFINRLGRNIKVALARTKVRGMSRVVGATRQNLLASIKLLSFKFLESRESVFKEKYL